MGEQEMQFADPDWKPRGARPAQQGAEPQYIPRPLYGSAFDTGENDDIPSYDQGYRGALRQEEMPYAPNYSQQMPPPQMARASGRSRWWIWVVIIIILFSLIGSMTRSFDGPHPFPGRFSDRQEQAQPASIFDLGNASLVQISNYSGSIQVEAGHVNSNQIEVQTDGANPNPPQEKVNGGTLTITFNPSQENSDIIVTVPSQVAVFLAAPSGNIEVDGYTGQVSAKTDSGSIFLNGDGLTGSSVVSSNSGNIILEKGSVSGTSSFSTASGSITLDQEALSGQFTTSAGGNGYIQFGGLLDPQGTYNFTSDMGNIDLTLPADASFKVQTSKGTGGSYSTDFPDTTGNAPWARLNLKTSSGGIDIHKQSFSG